MHAITVVLLLMGQLHVPEPRCDVGRVTGGFVQHSFVLENRGETSLPLGPIRPSCGACASAHTSAPSIGAGGMGSVDVTIDLANKAGRFEEVFQVLDLAGQTLATLTVVGLVDSPYHREPAPLLLRAESVRDGIAGTVRVHAARPLHGDLVRASTSHPAFSATVKPQGPGLWDVAVAGHPPLPPGRTEIRVTVYSSSLVDPPCRARVVAYAVPDLEILPPELVFGSAPSPQDRILFIRQHNGDRFELIDVRSSLPSIACRITEEGNGNYRVDLRALGLDMVSTEDAFLDVITSPPSRSFRLPLRVR